jgi:TonB-dependent receptor
MSRSPRQHALYVALAVALAPTVTPLWAQSNQPPDAATSDATSLDGIVVTGQRLSQERAIDFKRQDERIIDAISADEIGQLPDKNAAESLERLPGISLRYDQGEGRYVAIRGIDGALNNVTVNGVALGTPDGDSRNMPLDVVSGQLASRIEVVKAATPDMDAQGLGGTINLVSQSPFDFGKPFILRGSAAVGAQQLNDEHPVQADLTIGGLFGADHQFGVLFGINYSRRDYRTYGIYPDDWREVDGIDRGMPINIKSTTYDLDRRRLGLSAALEFRPTLDDTFHLRALHSDFQEDEVRQRYRLDFAGNGQLASADFNGDGRSGTTYGVERRQDLRLEEKDKSVSSVSIGAEHLRGDWTVDYDLSLTRNELVEPNSTWQFRGGSVDVDFDMGPALFSVVPRQDAPASDLGFRSHGVQDERGEEKAVAYAFNARRELHVADGGYLKFGVKHRDTGKWFDGLTTTYGRAGAGPDRFSLGDFGLAGRDSPVRLDDRTYQNGPTIDAGAIRQFTRENIDGGRFVLNVEDTLADAVLSDYDVDEKVSAAYVMASIDRGNWTTLFGARVERTQVDVRGYRLENGTDVVPVSSNNSYTDVLPAVHVRYEPTSDLVFRAAYTESIGRPSYSQMSPGGSLEFVELAPGLYEGALSEGNVALEPYQSRNFDVSAEWYPTEGTMLSAGLFHKKIDNPIFGYEEVRRDYTYNGRLHERFEYSQPRNADEGDITGLELAYQQQLTFLPGLWNGFGVGANVTFIESSLDVPGRSEEATFPKQAETLYGIQLFYQKHGLEAAINYHYTDDFLDSIQDSPGTDTFFAAQERLDFKVGYALNDHVGIFLEAQNLTDEVNREIQGGRKDWIIGHERYGRTYYAGLTARW